MVRLIFAQYLAGASLKTIAEDMSSNGTPYIDGKAWNKNMVARILENDKYTGCESFDALIDAEIYAAAARLRTSKTAPIQKTAAQKELRRLCHAPITPQIELQVTSVLNRLIETPSLVCVPPAGPESVEVKRLQHEWEQEMGKPDYDEDAAKTIALSLTAAQFDAIGSEEYETLRIQESLHNYSSSNELNAELLCQIVRSITVHSCGKVDIILKNGQIIKGGSPS